MKTTSNHSWVVGCSTERDAAPGLVHILDYGKSGPYKTVAVAKREEDAPLLAAAPDLLEALEELALMAGNVRLGMSPMDAQAQGLIDVSRFARAIVSAREVITKAKGGAQ